MPDHLWIGFKFYANDDAATEAEATQLIAETMFGETGFDHLAGKPAPSKAGFSEKAEQPSDLESFDYSEVFDLSF